MYKVIIMNKIEKNRCSEINNLSSVLFLLLPPQFPLSRYYHVYEDDDHVFIIWTARGHHQTVTSDFIVINLVVL